MKYCHRRGSSPPRKSDEMRFLAPSSQRWARGSHMPVGKPLTSKMLDVPFWAVGSRQAFHVRRSMGAVGKDANLRERGEKWVIVGAVSMPSVYNRARLMASVIFFCRIAITILLLHCIFRIGYSSSCCCFLIPFLS